jgi:hypothetical protein
MGTKTVIKLDVITKVGNSIREGGMVLFVERVSARQAEALKRLGFLVIIPR